MTVDEALANVRDNDMAVSQFVSAQVLADEVERLRKELDVYRKLYDHAIKCVDEAFQESGDQHPILPDFCRPGDDKFKAIPRLAIVYKVSEQMREYWQDKAASLAARNR